MEKKFQKILSFVFIFLIINSSLIFTTTGETTINADNEDEIDQQQTQVNSVELIYNGNQIAQSFTPTLPKITRIKLYLSKKGEISSDFTLVIKEKLMESSIKEVSVAPENIPEKQPEWIEFDFPDIDSKSDIYYFICKTDSGDQDNYYEIYCYTLDLYENGIGYTSNNNGNTWQQKPNLDFTFKTYGEGPILNIEFIRGLPGGKINIGIKNIGTSDADNLKITATFSGGLMLKRFYEEKPNTLEPDYELHVEISPIIGLGITTLTIYVTSDNAERIETERKVFIFFFYVYIKPI